ncbi:voltage-gated chloride channel family protein [Mucilaginibacter sp. RS28]|uniref:Voltage-gated chloride channel family protein n=1 Tax=Mucilaginibacter straminoryzae TaxID=2932774 RepID=A0A9X1X6K5_9SPHI|nr:voltage-gated chloride channel family protein [Mucilaginibacter straminoryzae]MCJ8212097.1 voltage-gated chloride channel family protein [Mucilaginibacter straminoryzae]
MQKILNIQLQILKYILRWDLIILPVAVGIGSMVALFLWLLNLAIHYRFAHPWLLYLLPLAGVSIHFLYKMYGSSAERGNNLIIDEIHEPGAGVPKRMAPLILLTTVITHLFGGSAGREGTAVQIGGSIANFFAGLFRMDLAQRQTLLTAGIAAGFGAVFGTPLTGTVFAMEVLTVGRIQYRAFFPCLIAAFLGDATVAAWHVHHTPYHIDVINTAATYYSYHFWFDPVLLLKVMISSVLFGFASILFEKATHSIKQYSLKLIKTAWLIPVLGGCLIILLTLIIGKPDYLSLGVDAEYPGAVTIVSSFHQGGAHFFSWLWKLVYTAITLGTGFKGGEVTPLFYIGSTLGNTLAVLMDAPVSLFAALGFIAVFSGATKTPIACTIMGMELFGPDHAVLFAVACFIAYLCSGSNGIYSAQRKPGGKLSYLQSFRSK